MIAAAVAWFDKSHRAALGFLVLGIVIPAAITLVVSHFKPVFWPRYLLLSQPFFAVFAGVAISRLRPWPLIPVALTALAVFCLQQDFLCYQRPQREDWPGAVQYVASKAQPGDVMMVFIGFGRQPIDYYRKRLLRGQNFPSLLYPDPNSDIPAEADVSMEDLFSTPHRRIWLVSTGSGIQPAPFRRAGKEPPQFSSVLKTLRESSYQMEDLARFQAVRVYLFDKVEP
jgi:hypothetical protein